MNDSTMHEQGQCPCGTTKFSIEDKPLFRMYCHCTLCQKFNDAPYADVTAFRINGIKLPENNGVNFETLRPPPAVQRGRCSSCNKPAIEFLRVPLFPKLAIVPSANIKDDALLPEPLLHMFYHRRIADIDDSLPKHSGYLRSQSVFGYQLISALLRN